MAERLTGLFWLTLLAALPVALATAPGLLHSMAIGWLAMVGTLFSFGNWLCLVAIVRTRQHVSFVPFVGGVLLALAGFAAGFGWRALVGMALDASIFAMGFAIPWSLARR